MTAKTKTRRQAKVYLSAVAEADWDETIDIPDDVRPEDVDEWIAEYVAGYRFGDVVHWDEAWLEAERLRPGHGQTDIFGGVVGAAPEGAA